MWRIYYYPNTGMIKYQINIEAASQMEPMPFVDYPNKQDIEGRKVDIKTKQLVPADPIPQYSPSFPTPDSFKSRPFPTKL